MSRQDISLSILPYEEMGNKGGPVILFLGGFPDNELSGWGCLIPEVLGRCYRLIFCCFPGFSATKGAVRPWGHSTNDLLTMMYLTINHVFSYELQSALKIVLVGHGIGAEYCVLFENRYPSLVSKLILCDGGIPRKITSPFPSLKECVDVITSSYTIVICHYVFFGLAYLVSELVGSYLIELVFKYLVTPTFALAMKVHTSKQQVSVKHCYLHYNWLKGLITSSSIEPRFPSCPVLFMVSLHGLLCYGQHYSMSRLLADISTVRSTEESHATRSSISRAAQAHPALQAVCHQRR